MSNDTRADTPHGARPHETYRLGGSAGGTQDRRAPADVAEPVARSGHYHYSVEWDTSAPEGHEASDTE